MGDARGQNDAVRRAALLLFALVAGVALALGPARPAHAHASLESSSPAASSVLDEAPTDITLDFDEPVTAQADGIRLLDSSSNPITVGAPEQGSDSSVVVAAVPDIPDGAYVVAWQVVSQDGHPLSGAFAFQIGREAAIDTRDLLASVLSGQAGDGTVEQLATFARLLTYAGLALGIGGAVFASAISPPASDRWSARRLVWLGWAAIALGTVGTILISGPYLTGRSIGSVGDVDLLRSVADTRVVQMAVIRLALVLLALPLVARLSRGWGGNAQLAGVLLGELIIGTVALAGHSGSGRYAALGVLLDAVHLAAMAVWLGGLALLVVLLPSSGPASPPAPDEPAEPDEAVASEAPVLSSGSVGAALAPTDVTVEERDERVEGVTRFSSVAFACVVALVVTGVAQTWRVLPGGLGDLTTTDYGRTLLVKLVFVAALVALGWGSRRLVARRLLGPPLWRSVATEVVIAVAVLVVTAILTGSPPAEAETSTRTVSVTMVQGDLLADVSVIPARVGTNDLHLTFSPPGGTLDAVKDATARLVLPARDDLGPLPVDLVPAGPNHYIANGLQIPYEGDWTLEVVATTAEDATVRMTTTLDVDS
jgi:copper transport protein